MKALLVVVLLIGVGAFVLVKYKDSTDAAADNPSQQGRETRAKIVKCTNWTEVLDRAGAPRKWRKATSDFDFNYRNRFDDSTRDAIVKMLKDNQLSYGFSFLYRFSDAVTFAVNFDEVGAMMNIQDREGQSALMDEAGG